MPAKPRVTIEEAARCYMQFITDQNAVETRANKISMLRRFLGTKRAEAIVGPSQSTKRFGAHRPKLGSGADVAFQGTYLDEVSASVVQQFIDRLGVATKTKRHYREFFHQFFEVCLRFDLYQATNFHRPNPIAALPNFTTRNRRIIFLKSPQIEQQHTALAEFPAMQMAADILIHAGLRRSEVLWLERDSIAPDLSFIKVLNGYDEEEDIEGSLKTGQRPVTILPELRSALDRYLQQLKSKWTIPTPECTRWSKDGFSRRLRIINKKHGLRWTCNHYRHTYATQRAEEGWPLFRIAKEMGNSVVVVEEYYAAYVRPHELQITSISAAA
jgi:integrase